MLRQALDDVLRMLCLDSRHGRCFGFVSSTYVNPELIWPVARRQQPAESDGFKSSVVHVEGRGS
jgi:hypothetical protein